MAKFQGKSKFVNGNRTAQQRKARYCFIRQQNIPRSLARTLAAYSDPHFVKTLKVMHECVKNVYLNADFTSKV